MKKIVVAILVLVLLAGGGFAGWYFLSETPKAKYFKAEEKASEDLKEELTAIFAKELDSFEKNNGKSYESKLNVSAKAEGKIEGEKLPKEITNAIESFSVDLNRTYDYKNKAFFDGVVVNFDGETVANAELLTKENALTLYVPQVHEDGFQIDGDKLGALTEKFDLGEGLPETFDFSTLYEVSTYEDLEKYEDALDKYGDYIFDSITDEQIIEEDFDKKVNGVEVKGESLTLQLSPKDTKALAKGLVETFENDKELRGMLEEDLLKGLEIEGMTKEEIKEEMDTAIADIKEGLEEIAGITVRSQIVLDKKGNIIHRDLTLKNEDGENVTLLWTKTKDGGVFVLGDDETKEALKDEYTFVSEKENLKTVHTFFVEEEETFTLSYDRKVEGDRVQDKLNVNVKYDAGSEENEINIYIQGDNSYEKSKVKGKTSIGLSIKGNEDGYENDAKGEIVIKTNSTFSDKVKVPTTGAKDVHVLHEISEKEVEEVLAEMEENVLPLLESLESLSNGLY